ncbi:MAG: endolytic transglycosylase MltG [Bacteroidales bacterium]|nr:endolytic transglycosylase MltG [Bacteroidales bacterium]
MKKLWTVAAAAVVLLMAVPGFFAARYFIDRKLPGFSRSLELYVYPDDSPASVLDSILAKGVVLREGSLRRAFRSAGASEGVQAGHYTVAPSSSTMYLARMLRHGWQTPVSLTLSGSIRSRGVLARKIGAQMMVDSVDVASTLNSPDFLEAHGTDTTLLFTKIIPETYSIKWTEGPDAIVERLFKEADSWWTPERLAKAAAQGLTREEVSTLASIVDGESHYAPELPRIAGVYLNRLRTGMLLQADPTVAYCFGYSLKRVLLRHLEYDSPYNTYKYKGLPPGPISCPPVVCLEAVLGAERHDYLYFCASPSLNGTHLFASSYEQHLRNARAFQKALSK